MSRRTAPAPEPSPAISSRSRVVGVALGLALATCLAYSNSLRGPFVFDDLPSLVDNDVLNGFEALWRVFGDAGRGDFGLAGRPVAAWTFALNRAFGGLEVLGYHVVNLAIHVAAGLVLFGLVRRTLERPSAAPAGAERGLARHAEALAACSAALFLLHPLQTKSVTFVVQRLESLTGLAYLLTLYAVLRGATARQHSARWYALAVLACGLGMGVKEVMVSAPLAVLLFDRAFLAGSFGAAWRARRTLYVGLASTWLFLAWLVASNPRLEVAGGLDAKLGVFDNLKLQAGALARYLGLWLYPRELVFDYGIFGDGVPPASSLTDYAPAAALVLALLAASLWAAARNRAAGFLGLASFLVLAPSSSFVPIQLDPVAEHRMYLPVAALSILFALGLQRLATRLAPSRALAITAAVCVACSLALGARTHARNRDYQSERALWSDTVAKRPGSARALTNLGVLCAKSGELERAEDLHRAAIAARPSYAQAHHNLANVKMAAKDYAAALESYRRALELDARSYEGRLGLGEALVQLGRNDEAGAEFEAALALRPGLYGAHRRLGAIRAAQQRIDDAIEHFVAALLLDGTDAVVCNLLGTLYAQRGEYALAEAQFRAALRVRPGFPDALANLERLAAVRAAAPR
jgi:tetratricopeptide (TPR) repeat protein